MAKMFNETPEVKDSPCLPVKVGSHDLFHADHIGVELEAPADILDHNGDVVYLKRYKLQWILVIWTNRISEPLRKFHF